MDDQGVRRGASRSTTRELLDSAMAVGPQRRVRSVCRAARYTRGSAGEQLAAPATADREKLDADARRRSPRRSTSRRATLPWRSRPRQRDRQAVGDGIAADRAALESDVLGAFTSDDRIVTVRATTAQPRITDAEAEQAKATVQKMLAGSRDGHVRRLSRGRFRSRNSPR